MIFLLHKIINLIQLHHNLMSFTPSDKTTLEGQVRTVSGTSAGGGEVSFIDQGYEPITLNQPNSLSSPRLVCSRINETTRLTDLPLNRSFTFGVRMESFRSKPISNFRYF